MGIVLAKLGRSDEAGAFYAQSVDQSIRSPTTTSGRGISSGARRSDVRTNARSS
jgi:hypothetical protein